MGPMLNLEDLLDLIFASGEDVIEVTLAVCPECECYHVTEDPGELCAVCKCIEERGELSEFLLERMPFCVRVRKDGTYFEG